MGQTVDLNSDLGEGFGAWKMGADETIMPLITSANVACGFHAGDPDAMQRAVTLAKEHKVALGAHPGFPDLLGFGRREMGLTQKEVANLILYQLGALDAFARAAGTKLKHVKPHGALYNMAAEDFQLASVIAEAVGHFDEGLIVVGLANSESIAAAAKFGLKTAHEVFADRNYEADGSLTPRHLSNALVKDPVEAANRVLRMLKEGKVKATDGSELSVNADTVCVHSDTPGSIAFASEVRTILQQNGIRILPMSVE
jgi:UPF0271 protein